MLKLFIFATLLISSNVFARSGTGGCVGNYRGVNVVLSAKMSDINRLETGIASVTINNKLMAQFEGGAMKISLLSKSFTIQNGQGDYAHGRLTNVFTKSGILQQLSIPRHGINILNLPVQCWTKKD